MKRILVIAPQFIGDSVLAIPFLRELKKHVGRCEVDVISKNAGCFVFSKCPYVSHVYDWNKLNIWELRAKKYDKAYVLKRSLSAALLAFKLGISDTIGFDGQFRHFFLKKTVKYRRYEGKHELEHFMDVLKADYVEINSNKLEYYEDENAINNVRKYFGNRKRALIVACSSTPVKNWSVDNFSDVLSYLVNNGYEVYFAGLEKERAYCDEIISKEFSPYVKNLCGVLSLNETFALVSQMHLVFGVDSGFCHLGAAFGKKVVTLFGPTDIEQWAPIGGSVITLNKVCSPCLHPKRCKENYSCMKELSSAHVISELERIL
ncbi:lipopolysaccharide heptosyltransferase II [bacterium]|nr:lipopolysaccharide heptosyltransferase II [bacterium]